MRRGAGRWWSRKEAERDTFKSTVARWRGAGDMVGKGGGGGCRSCLAGEVKQVSDTADVTSAGSEGRPFVFSVPAWRLKNKDPGRRSLQPPKGRLVPRGYWSNDFYLVLSSINKCFRGVYKQRKEHHIPPHPSRLVTTLCNRAEKRSQKAPGVQGEWRVGVGKGYSMFCLRAAANRGLNFANFFLISGGFFFFGPRPLVSAVGGVDRRPA